MNITFFILLCLTHYCPPVYSMNKKNIDDLWSFFNPYNKPYITYEDYLGEDQLNFNNAILTYSSDIGKSRLNYAEFTDAANLGLISIMARSKINDLWNLVNPTQKLYITEEDYGDYGDVNDIRWIITDYGAKTEGNEIIRIDYAQFTWIANLGFISKWPKHVLMNEFLKLLPKVEPIDFNLSIDDMKELKKYNGQKYTLKELEMVMADFGYFVLYEQSTSTNIGRYLLPFNTYIRAVALERLPGPSIEEIEVRAIDVLQQK